MSETKKADLKAVKELDEKILKTVREFEVNIKKTAEISERLDGLLILKDREIKHYTILIELRNMLDQYKAQVEAVGDNARIIEQIVKELPEVNPTLIAVKDSYEQSKLKMAPSKIILVLDEMKEKISEIKVQ